MSRKVIFLCCRIITRFSKSADTQFFPETSNSYLGKIDGKLILVAVLTTLQGGNLS